MLRSARMQSTLSSAGVSWTNLAMTGGKLSCVNYAAKYATLPPLPAHLTLPAPVWSFLSSIVLLYLQPTLLTALAQHMAWPMPMQPTAPNAIHFTHFSAGSYTAIALEAEYRLLSQRLQQPLCPGCATLGGIGCPVLYLLALLQPHYCAGDHQLVSNARTVRIIHLWDDQLCPWHPSLAELQAVTTAVHPTLPTPSVLIQLLDAGTGPRRPKWFEEDTHNYAHLLQATVPRHPALLAVKATLPELCAYSATFAPPDALEELSWAASAAPFQPLTAAQLQRAAASDEGAHRLAELLLRRAILQQSHTACPPRQWCASGQ